jgi:hypothetical protein
MCTFKRIVTKAEKKFFSHNGKTISAMMKPYSDGFYEITKGKHRGSLVHVWNIIK